MPASVVDLPLTRGASTQVVGQVPIAFRTTLTKSYNVTALAQVSPRRA